MYYVFVRIILFPENNNKYESIYTLMDLDTHKELTDNKIKMIKFFELKKWAEHKQKKESRTNKRTRTNNKIK